MTEKERNLVEELTEISSVIQDSLEVERIKQKFLNDFPVNILKYPNYVVDLLETAYRNKEAYDVEFSLSIGFIFDIFTEDFTNILCKLLESDWHFQHENIVLILQDLKSSNSVNSLYKAALTKYQYLEYSDAYPLATKCIWALGDINTYESRCKLKLLSQSNDEIIREKAKKQLTRQ